MTVLHTRSIFLAALLSFLSFNVAQAATLPEQFTETRIATGLASPTAMAFAPDGRVLVAQQGGALRVIRNDQLIAQPFVTLSVNASGERGLLGVAFDPNFAINNHVYVYYTTASAPIHNRVSRFTADSAAPDQALAGSEVQLLNLPTLSSATNHNGGAIHFGSDGKLYIAVGDNANSANSQSLTTTLGKLLRINADGTIPADNPFLSQTTGINQSIYARGLRNPFNFAIDSSNGRLHVNDVGQNSWEEVNHAIAGANFGWPQTEGPTPAGAAGVRYPVHAYQNAGSSCAITGAAFYRPASLTFPAEYHGRYFFGDYCGGFIHMLDPPNYTTSTAFATGISSLVDLQVAPNGSLYYLARGGGDLFRVTFTDNTGPSIVSHPQNISVAEGQIATFSASASGATPLRYQWQRNGSRIQGATAPSYSFVTSRADNGAVFRVVVTNTNGLATSESATLTVLNTLTPTGTITTPGDWSAYRAGQTISFAGTGTDPNDGTLPASAFTWRVDFHRADQVLPHMPPTSGITTGSFTIPNRGPGAENGFYRITLSVRDSSGATHTSSVDIYPLVSSVQIGSNVPGVQLMLDGAPITAPYRFTSVEGAIHTVGVLTPQTIGGITYNFTSWSDGGQATHEITTPSGNTTYLAQFQSAAPATVFSDSFETDRGWTFPVNFNTAPRGRWQRGDPQPTTFNGVTIQPGTCDGPSVSCLITGLAAGNAVGSADVDEGITSIQSPAMTLPANGLITLAFRYFFAHNDNASAADYFRVRVVRANGTIQTLLIRSAMQSVVAGAWTSQTLDLSAFAGQTVRLRFEAADAALGSIIEAGVDNVTVTRQ